MMLVMILSLMIQIEIRFEKTMSNNAMDLLHDQAP